MIISEKLLEKIERYQSQGLTIKQMATKLVLNENTLKSWIYRGKLEAVNPKKRLTEALILRCEKLIAKDDKTPADDAEIDKAFGYLERLDKLNRYTEKPQETAEGEAPKKKPGRPKASDGNTLSQEDVDKLVAALYSLCFRYQLHWWAAREHDGRIILKSRQIGATFYFALEALIIAITTGHNQIFISASKKQAAQFRRNIIRFVNKVLGKDLKGDPMRLILPESEFKEVYIYYLGTQVSSVQGYSGDLYLDECAWVRNFADIQEVASGMALQARYRETYFTTPSSMEHDFYRFWNGDDYNQDRKPEEQIKLNISHDHLKNGVLCGDGFWRQIVTIYDAIDNGCTLFDIEKVKRKYSEAKFAMLCLCQFVSREGGVFSFGMLMAACVNYVEKWPDFKPYAARPLGNDEVWLGYDPAGEGDDAAAIVLVAKPTEKYPKFRVIEVLRMDETLFDAQAEKIYYSMGLYNITYMGIDNQGCGAGVYQQVLKRFPQAEAIRYTPESKSNMVVKLQALLKANRIEINDVAIDDIIPSMLAIQRSVTSAGVPTYSAKRSEATGHADVAWALMHAINNAEFETLLDETIVDAGDTRLMFF